MGSRDFNVITPHAWGGQVLVKMTFPRPHDPKEERAGQCLHRAWSHLGVSLHKWEKYLTRHVTPLKDPNQAFLPGSPACLPSKVTLVSSESQALGFPKSHRRYQVGLGQDVFTFTASQLEFTRCCRKGPKPETKDTQVCSKQPRPPSNNLDNLGAVSELS